MLMRFFPKDIDLCARAIAVLGGEQPDDVSASLSWVIKNRLNSVAGPRAVLPDLARVCREVLWEAAELQQSGHESANLSNSEWCRIYAVNCLVWAGDLDDPTNGATSCHRHDTIRKWARSRTPTALLGPFIFYR
jgi:hypothetical protein